MFFGFCWVASLIAFFAGDWRIASRETEKAELPVPEVEAEVQGGETSKRMFSRRRSSTSSKNPGSGGSVPVGHYRPAIPRFKWSPRWSTTKRTSREGSVGGAGTGIRVATPQFHFTGQQFNLEEPTRADDNELFGKQQETMFEE